MLLKVHELILVATKFLANCTARFTQVGRLIRIIWDPQKPQITDSGVLEMLQAHPAIVPRLGTIPRGIKRECRLDLAFLDPTLSLWL